MCCLHNLTHSDLAVKTIKIILFFFNLRYLTSRKRLTIEAYPCETTTIINCHLCIKIPISFNSVLSQSYNTSCKSKSSEYECDGNDEDADDGCASAAGCPGAGVALFAKHVVEAGKDGPRNAAEQELAFLQLAADVHVGEEEALPVTSSFFVM